MKKIANMLVNGLALLSLTAVLPIGVSAARADGFSFARVPSLQGARARQGAQADRHGSPLGGGVSWLAIVGAAALAGGVVGAVVASRSDKPVSPGS